MSPEKAAEAYDLLIREAGAPSDDRTSFIIHLSKESPATEYRFQGALGFGGKFRAASGGDRAPRVDCYPEDSNPERREIIDRTNRALEVFHAAPESVSYAGDPDVLSVKERRLRAAR